MRVPLGKVYRAFKELDQFDDRQCEWYVRRANRKHLLSMILVGIAAVVATLATIGALLVAVRWMLRVLEQTRLGASIALSNGTSNGAMAMMLLGVLMPAVLGLVVGLSIRDLWLRWAIRKELVQSDCPKCDYQLLGLPVQAGVVRCPECGTDTNLDVEVPKSTRCAAAVSR